MESSISKENREWFERYLEEHPPKEELEPGLFDDDRMNHDHEAGAANLIKLLLEGKIK